MASNTRGDRRRRRRRSGRADRACPRRSRCRCPGTSGHAARGDIGVLEQVEGDEFKRCWTPRRRRGWWRVAAGAGTQVVRDVVHRGLGQRAAHRARPRNWRPPGPATTSTPPVVSRPWVSSAPLAACSRPVGAGVRHAKSSSSCTVLPCQVTTPSARSVGAPRETVMAPQRLPCWMAGRDVRDVARWEPVARPRHRSGRWRTSPDSSPAMNESPAPTVSTTRVGGAARVTKSPSRQSEADAVRRVATVRVGPRCPTE